MALDAPTNSNRTGFNESQGLPFDVRNGCADHNRKRAKIESLLNLIGLVDTPFEDDGNVHFTHQTVKQPEPRTLVAPRFFGVPIESCADYVHTEFCCFNSLPKRCDISHDQRIQAGL